MPFDGTQLNETAAHLLRAKRYIEEHGWSPDGWSSGRMGISGPDRCVAGAIFTTDTKGGVWDSAASRVYSRAIGRLNIPRWNDAPGRTIEEVYAAFDRAIALAMEAGDA